MDRYLLNNNSPKIEQPENINIKLKPHQLTSLYKMLMLDQSCSLVYDDLDINSNIGIFGDLAGYGKTITFLSLIDCMKNKELTFTEKSFSYSSYGYGMSIYKKKSTKKFINTSLIVVPNNVINHWIDHINKYTKLNYEVVEDDLISKIIVDDYDVIVCPASNYNDFIFKNNEYCWNRVAFDEADSINIPNTRYVKTRFLWLITATYENIYRRYNRGFLKDIIYAKNKQAFSGYYPIVIKGEDKFVKKSFNIIEPNIKYIECITPSYLNVIQNHISNKTLELINAGDINGAIVSLGGNIDTDRNIIKLVTRNINNNITIITSKIETLSSLDITDIERENREKVLKDKLEILNYRKKSLEENIQNVSTTDCIICYNILVNPTIIPCCKNIFCGLCLLKWFKERQTCPVCRDKIKLNELNTISEEKTNEKTDKKCKINTIINIIKGKKGKFIIFSGYDFIFNKIGNRLKDENIIYGKFNTDKKTINTLEMFKKDEINVILLNSHNNGAGLEIPEATDIILVHEFKEDVEKQAIARAQRPGRKSQLNVWKLKYDNEYIKI